MIVIYKISSLQKGLSAEGNRNFRSVKKNANGAYKMMVFEFSNIVLFRSTKAEELGNGSLIIEEVEKLSREVSPLDPRVKPENFNSSGKLSFNHAGK